MPASSDFDAGMPAEDAPKAIILSFGFPVFKPVFLRCVWFNVRPMILHIGRGVFVFEIAFDGKMQPKNRIVGTKPRLDEDIAQTFF